MKPEFTIPQSLGNDALKRACAEVADAINKQKETFIRDKVIEITRQLILSQDVTLIETYDAKFAVNYYPYSGLVRLQEKFRYYKEVVNSILNEDQRKELAQKLHNENTL